MKKIVFLLFAISIYFKGYSQINPDHIEIIRDNYGVPHIYAATDLSLIHI